MLRQKLAEALLKEGLKRGLMSALKPQLDQIEEDDGGIDFLGLSDVKPEGNILWGKGYLFATPKRLVIYCNKRSHSFFFADSKIKRLTGGVPLLWNAKFHATNAQHDFRFYIGSPGKFIRALGAENIIDLSD